MIEGFEDFTGDVKDSELKVINLIAKGLNNRVGEEHAITNREARKMMYMNKGINISDPKFRKYIQYIRAYNLCPMLCSSGKGYWIAKSKEEFIKNRDRYASRVRSMSFTLSCMFHYGIENNVINN